jgi:hypothetical protein
MSQETSAEGVNPAPHSAVGNRLPGLLDSGLERLLGFNRAIRITYVTA